MTPKAIWIAWERHRRSVLLSSAFGAIYHELRDIAPTFVRHVLSSARTIWILLTERPDLLFVQNPSIVLAALASSLKKIFSYRLIVDRHTTFLLNKTRLGLLDRLHRALSDFTLRQADLTIVTNNYLAEVVARSGGRAAVLQDRLPDFGPAAQRKVDDVHRGVLVCSFGKDEPVAEAIDALRALIDVAELYITGDSRRIPRDLVRKAPANVTFTGFLPEDEFVDLLRSADFVMVLTRSEHVLLCGAYEGLAAERPLILSDRKVLREYFTKGAIFVSNDCHSIAAGIRTVRQRYSELEQQVSELRVERAGEWERQFRVVRALAIGSTGAAHPAASG